MTRHVKRDPDTGEIRANGGGVGTLWSVLKFLQPFIAAAMFVVMPAIVGLLIRIEVRHAEQANFNREVRQFMSVGPRLTPQMLADERERIKLEVMEAAQVRFPPEWMRDKVDAIGEQVGRNTEVLSDLRADVAEAKAEIRAVRLLLEDD